MSGRIVLASTSRYRAALLRRIVPAFDAVAPDTDEAPVAGENAAARATRLAIAKASSVAKGHPDAIVIGSDQVAALDEEILRKPGDAASARAQLTRFSARIVTFQTAVCLVDPDGREHTDIDTTHVHFRPLKADAIARYVAAEAPLDCAGSFKCEGLGIALFERIESNDPTALVGLPLIATARLLRECGVILP